MTTKKLQTRYLRAYLQALDATGAPLEITALRFAGDVAVGQVNAADARRINPGNIAVFGGTTNASVDGALACVAKIDDTGEVTFGGIGIPLVEQPGAALAGQLTVLDATDNAFPHLCLNALSRSVTAGAEIKAETYCGTEKFSGETEPGTLSWGGYLEPGDPGYDEMMLALDDGATRVFAWEIKGYWCFAPIIVNSYSDSYPLNDVAQFTGGALLSGAIQRCRIPEPDPLVLTVTHPNGTIGTAYDASVSAVGGIGPYVYAIAAGRLPSGVSLAPDTGAITGTPTTAGTSNVTFRVTDKTGTSAVSASTPFRINAPPLTVQANCPSADVGDTYVGSVTAAGGVPDYAYQVSTGALPQGLQLNQQTGAITGTAAREETKTVTFTVTDSKGTTAVTDPIDIVIDEAG